MLVFFFITPRSTKEVCMFFFIASEFHELNVINVSLIINIYNRGAVTGNGLLRNRLCGKAGVRFCLSVRCAVCGAGLFFNIL